MDTKFVSLGGVWLDEIRLPGRDPVKDVVGGSATYALLGSRFFAPEDPSSLVLIVNAGKDFPQHVVDDLKTWKVRVSIIVDENRYSTRGILEHLGTAGSRFTRLTPPLLTSPGDLVATGAIDSKVIHAFAVPDLIQSQYLQIEQLRRQAGIEERPIIVWEPNPKSCTQPMLKEHLALLHDGAITVFSPNHHELNSFFEDSTLQTPFDRQTLEERARVLLSPPKHRLEHDRQAHIGVQVIIIRAAENGCMIMLRGQPHAVWFPAYFGPEQQDRVIDPTGAGNSFLGALTQGFLQTGNWIIAACYGSVAASIVVESVGPPRCHGEGLNETWASVAVRARLSNYVARPEVRKELEKHC